VLKSATDPADLIYGVPPESVLGPILFSFYTTPLNKILSTYKTVNYHFYVDDTQLYIYIYIYISLTPTNFSTATLQTYLTGVQSWMITNKLKLNPDKIEFILLGNKSQWEKLAVFFPVDILGNVISPTDKARNLGVIFYSDFSFSSHVASICRSCWLIFVTSEESGIISPKT